MRPAPALCSVTFRALPYAHVLSLAVRAGVEAIEWGADVHVPAGNIGRARAVAAKSRERGVAVGSYGSYFEAGATPVEDFAEVVRTASALGAPNIRVWAGRRGVDSKDVATDDRVRAVRDLHTISEMALDAGISISLEFHRQTLTDSLASTLDVLDGVAHANLYTYWQPRPGIALTESKAELRALCGRLAHLHVFNWNANRERFLLEEAGDFWPEIFALVADWNTPAFARRFAMIEFVRNDDLDAFGRDARTMRVWLDSLAATRGAASGGATS